MKKNSTLYDMRQNAKEIFHCFRFVAVDIQRLENAVQRVFGFQRQIEMTDVADDLLQI